MQNTFLQAYGLDALLTAQDDPLLWEAALRQHWPRASEVGSLIDALRFDIGRRLAEGELAQGEVNEQHAKMRGMVDIEEWCFEHTPTWRLRVKTCPPEAEAAPALIPGPTLAALISGMVPFAPAARQTVFMYLGITRPSRDAAQAVVYAASSMPGAGEGSAHLWQRQEDGSWVQLNQRVAWWRT